MFRTDSLLALSFMKFVVFNFFIIIKSMNIEMIKKSKKKKTLLSVVEHTFNFRMIPVL